MRVGRAIPLELNLAAHFRYPNQTHALIGRQCFAQSPFDGADENHPADVGQGIETSARPAGTLVVDEPMNQPLVSNVVVKLDLPGMLRVIGGAGDYFDVADLVIQMDSYLPFDVTAKAKAIAADSQSDTQMYVPFLLGDLLLVCVFERMRVYVAEVSVRSV